MNVLITGKKCSIQLFITGQSEIEKACDMLYEKAESIDYRYDVQDRKVEGLLILPLYGSMPTGRVWCTVRVPRTVTFKYRKTN